MPPLGFLKILRSPVLADVLCIFLAPSSAFEARFGGKSNNSERVNYRQFLWCNDPISSYHLICHVHQRETSTSFQRNICDVEK